MNLFSTSTRLPVAVQILVLLLVSILCGAATQLLLPHRVPWIGSWNDVVESGARKDGISLIDLAGAQDVVKTQYRVIFDARKLADYEKGHLPGAFALPHDDIDTYFQPLLPLLVADQPVMTYCAGKDCDEALELTRYLRRNGFTNVVLFLGGFEEWDGAGLPVEGRKP
jgi:rhodanese-related sulfurtransferase